MCRRFVALCAERSSPSSCRCGDLLAGCTCARCDRACFALDLPPRAERCSFPFTLHRTPGSRAGRTLCISSSLPGAL